MNSGRLVGIVAIVVGFALTALAGLWLALQASGDEVSSGGVVIGAFIAFIVVAPIFGFGIFMYAKGGEEEELESEMTQQRKLLDIVKSRGQVGIHDLAIELGTSVDNVKDLVYRLVGLQVFSGYINWDKGVLYSAEASSLRELQECKNCGAPIELAGKGVVACKFCGTEYFLP